jgi:hypothetical protein
MSRSADVHLTGWDNGKYVLAYLYARYGADLLVMERRNIGPRVG